MHCNKNLHSTATPMKRPLSSCRPKGDVFFVPHLDLLSGMGSWRTFFADEDKRKTTWKGNWFFGFYEHFGPYYNHDCSTFFFLEVVFTYILGPRPRLFSDEPLLPGKSRSREWPLNRGSVYLQILSPIIKDQVLSKPIISCSLVNCNSVQSIFVFFK